MTSRPLLVVRPEPGNAVTVASARARGLNAVAAPLFAIEPVAWTVPPVERFDALLLGSANAVRCGGAGLAGLTGLAAYTVGEATADAARQAGFAVAGSGSGGLAELIPKLAADGRRRILRLAGEEHVELDPPPGMQVETVVAYRARALALPEPARASLEQKAVVLLHSAAAARYFAALCERARIARGNVALACLGVRVADAAGRGWDEVRTAPRPTDAALLVLAAEMCQSR